MWVRGDVGLGEVDWGEVRLGEVKTEPPGKKC